jgi:hypothetical protein
VQQGACAPLAILHGAEDTVVHSRCADQLQEQALASLGREGGEVAEAGAGSTATTTVTDFRSDGALRLRRIDVAKLGHQWSGGPGGHPYCVRDGVPLAAICEQFLRDTGVLGRGGA